MSEEIKTCTNCQQVIKFEKKRDKYYSVILKEQHIYLCPNCWELKKDDYKEKLKQEAKEETERTYRSVGNNQKIDKNSSEIVYKVCAFESKKLGDSYGWGHSNSKQFGVCFGCDNWNDKEEINHEETCKEKIADKQELESLQSREDWENGTGGTPGLPLDNQEKQRLAELKRKYSSSPNQRERERERERESKPPQGSQGFNWKSPWVIGGGIIIFGIIGIIIYFLTRKNKTPEEY